MIILLLYPFLFLFHSFHYQQPVERWLVELKSSSFTCLEEWRMESGLDEKNFYLKKLPVEDWVAVRIPYGYSASLSSLSCINRILPDEKIIWRNTEPDDPAYINQADMNLI